MPQDTLGAVRLVAVEGLTESGKLAAGQRVSFRFEIENEHTQPISRLINGFEVYSTDGVVWYPGHICELGECDSSTCVYGSWIDCEFWQRIFYVPPITLLPVLVKAAADTGAGMEEILGHGADSLFFYPSSPYWDPVAIGIAPGSRHLAWSIALDSISSESVGRSLSIDSVQRYYSLSGSGPPVLWFSWRWFVVRSNIDGDAFTPKWDGPHHFEIAADCCEGVRGNVDLDTGRLVNMSDLVYAVDWMFRLGPAPPCLLEADVDGNGSHDIADITFLVKFAFKDGPGPAGCP